MNKNKYIVGIVLGFVVIVGLGLVSTRLFRAKKSVAPNEQEQAAALQNTPAPTGTSSAEAQFVMPRVTSTETITTGELPAAVTTFFGETKVEGKVAKVVFEGGKTGYAFQREIPSSLATINTSLRSRLVENKSLLSYRLGDATSMFAFKTEKPAGRVVVTLVQKDAALTNFSGFLILE